MNTLINQQNLIQETQTIMNELNTLLFDGKLNLKYLPIKLTNSSAAAGAVMFKGLGYSFDRIYLISDLRISKNFAWTKKTLTDVIAHELIHIYEAQILKIKPSHGIHFKAKMNELNSKFTFLNITLRHSMKSTKEKALKKVTYLLSEDKKKIVFISESLRKRVSSINDVEKTFGNYTLGEVCSSQIKGYRVARMLRYSYKVTPDLLSKINVSL